MSDNNKLPALAIVMPCFNEEEVLPLIYPIYQSKLCSLISIGKISEKSRIVYVDDGSKDHTWEIIKKYSKNGPCEGVCLSRNKGTQNAIMAGLKETVNRFDVFITADCDGQDDIDVIDSMLLMYEKGKDVVYGVRKDRPSDSFFKKHLSQCFYRIMNVLGSETLYNHSEYRLMSRRVINALIEYNESNLYIRGIVPQIGFESDIVYYDRKERMAGKTKFSFIKLTTFAIDAITSMSSKPVLWIAVIGFMLALGGLIGLSYFSFCFFTGNSQELGLIISLICFIGGLNTSAIGIVGTYVGKTYLESKRRPRYFIKETVGNNQR